MGLSLYEAGRIADVLGCSLDELAGRPLPSAAFADARQNEMNVLFAQLDETRKAFLLEATKGVGRRGPPAGRLRLLDDGQLFHAHAQRVLVALAIELVRRHVDDGARVGTLSLALFATRSEVALQPLQENASTAASSASCTSSVDVSHSPSPPNDTVSVVGRSSPSAPVVT